MSRYASKKAANTTPYVPGEQLATEGLIKLNTNENPFPPSPSVRAVLDNIDIAALRLYNDPNNTELKKRLAAYEGVEAENIFVGNGSDEVLSMCFPAFCDTSVAFSEVTYSFYEVYARYNGLKINYIKTNERLKADPKSLMRAKGDMLIICNPNAPTGQIIMPDDIAAIIEANENKVVLIDEAYADFCGISSVEMTKKYDNLLVVKTFSKAYSLAGIRCGYAVGNKELIDTLMNVRDSINSYTVNAITEQIAMAAIEDSEYMRMTVKAILSSKQIFTKAMQVIGFDILPSSTNFIFCSHPDICAKELYSQLKENNILVRHFDKPGIDNYLRITIGRSEQMAQVFRVIDMIIDKVRGFDY